MFTAATCRADGVVNIVITRADSAIIPDKLPVFVAVFGRQPGSAGLNTKTRLVRM